MADDEAPSWSVGRIVSGVLPELQFDIIARMIPGMFVVGLSTYYGAGTGDPRALSSIAQANLGSAGAVFLFLIAAYVAGTLIGVLADPVRHGFVMAAVRRTRAIKVYDPVMKAFDFAADGDEYGIHDTLHYHLKRADPSWALLLPKVSAEVVFCSSMAAGNLIFGGWQFAVHLLRGSASTLWVLHAAGFVLALWACWNRASGYVQRQFAMARSLVQEPKRSGPAIDPEKRKLDKEPHITMG